MSARAFAVFIAVLAVIGLLGYGLLNKSAEALEPGEVVPANSLPTLSGEGSGSIADYRGRWVLVNVWASWCTPCRDESPALERFYRAHRERRFMILGIDSNDLSDDALTSSANTGSPIRSYETEAATTRRRSWGRRAFPSRSWWGRTAGWCSTASAP